MLSLCIKKSFWLTTPLDNLLWLLHHSRQLQEFSKSRLDLGSRSDLWGVYILYNFSFFALLHFKHDSASSLIPFAAGLWENNSLVGFWIELDALRARVSLRSLMGLCAPELGTVIPGEKGRRAQTGCRFRTKAWPLVVGKGDFGPPRILQVVLKFF